jgi:hypothetical protein
MYCGIIGVLCDGSVCDDDIGIDDDMMAWPLSCVVTVLCEVVIIM